MTLATQNRTIYKCLIGGKNMRKKTARDEILLTLKNNPEGLTASEIMDKMNPKKTRSVRNPRHVSNLLKGMKGVKKIHKKRYIKDIETWSYKVNIYYYDDEGAEI